jgi:mono/diheme cytochrome c family protein
MKRAATAIGGLIIIAFLAGALFVYSGLYDIGADRPHWAVTESILRTLRDRSLDAASASIEVPKLDNADSIAKGARQYAEMCAGCHLSPLSRDSDTRRGLSPQPPDLYRERVAPARAFRAIKHGIKMSGMPAWGATHDDRAIWDLVAFLQKMPQLDADAYRKLAAEARGAKAPGGHSH